MSASVGASIEFGIGRARDILFRPFQFKKWAALAVAGMLMLTGEGGFSGGGNWVNSSRRGPGGGGGRGGPTFDDAMRWIQAHLVMIGVIVLLVVLVGTAVYLLYRWLNSRGHFMMYDAVVKDRVAPGELWNANRRLGNSLFRFRIVYDLLLFNVFLLVLIIAGALAWPDVRDAIATGNYPFSGWTISAIIVGGLLFLVSSLLTLFATGFIFGLVLPVMYVRDIDAWPAVKETWRELVRPSFGPCVLYLLFRIVIAMVRAIWQGVTLVLFLFATCCIPGMIALAIPVAGMYPVAFLSMPVLVFERAYALHFVSQFGPAYAVQWHMAGGRGFPVDFSAPAGGDLPSGPGAAQS
jgi:hypothetical protein